MAKQIIGAEVQVEFQSVGNLRKAIKDANSELIKTQQAFGVASKEAFEAAKRVNNLKDAIKDANEVADLFDPGNRFKAVGNAVNALAGGFTAVQGALGLLGVKSEEVEKQLLRVQSALALSQGLSTILDSQKEFVRLGAIIKNQVVAAFTTLRGAIIATGILGLVAAIGTLIANFDKLKNLIDGVSDSQKDLAETSKEIADTEQKKLDTLGDQDNILKLQGKSEKEILDIKIKQTEEVISLREQQLKAAQELKRQQIEGAERNTRILTGIIDFITKPLQFLIRKTNEALNLFGLGTTGERIDKALGATTAKIAGFVVDNPEEVAKEADKGIQEIEQEILKLRNQRAGFILSQRSIKEKAKDLGRVFPEVDVLTDPVAIDGILKEISTNVPKLTKQLSDIAVNPELEKVRRALLLTPEQQDLLNLQDYYNQQFALVKGNQVLELELTKQFEEQKTALTRQYNEQRLQIVSNVLGQAANLLGKQTAAGKALAIAEATINTYLGASQVLRSPSILPEPFGTALKVAQTAIIIGNGLKSVREIAKTKVPGGSGSSVPSISTGAPLQAQLSPGVQAQALNANAINNLAQQPTRAYILDRDIQDQSQINSFITRNARI